MTTTTIYTLTAGQLITRALQILGQLSSMSQGQGPSPDQVTRGMQALNIMLKGMQADGINIGRQTQISLTVGAGVGIPALYGAGGPINPPTTFGLVLGLEDARWLVSPAPNFYERPLGVFSYLDYMTLPNKQASSTSGPSIICFDKQNTVSNFYIWPLSSTGGTLNMSVGRTIADVNALSDPLDFPIEWTEGLMYCLADRMMDDGGVAAADPQTADRIVKHSVAFYEKLLNFDRPASIYIRPWGKRGTGRLYR
jgi:hypothetical protein